MTINEEHRQAEIARDLEDLTRTLAHSTRTVPKPAESYRMLAELDLTAQNLAQVCTQLAHWHGRVEDGTHYAGEDADHEGSAEAVAVELTAAARDLTRAAERVAAAHARSSAIRWRDSL